MKKILIPIICLFLFFSSVSFVFAEDTQGTTITGDNQGTTITEERNTQTTELDNPLGTTSVPEIVGRVIKAFLGIIGTISLVIFIYAGFILLTSKGSPDKIKTGQSAIVWASLGILLVFAAYAILKFVFNVIGI